MELSTTLLYESSMWVVIVYIVLFKYKSIKIKIIKK